MSGDLPEVLLEPHNGPCGERICQGWDPVEGPEELSVQVLISIILIRLECSDNCIGQLGSWSYWTIIIGQLICKYTNMVSEKGFSHRGSHVNESATLNLIASDWEYRRAW